MTAYELARRYVGIHEIAGANDQPLILWWLSLTLLPAHQHDETSWCSAFVNGIAWELGLPRTRSAAARSWLAIGRPVALAEAEAANDVVVLSRGEAPQPGPEVLDAPGHVGFFSALQGPQVELLGGNQGDAVCLASFPVGRVLGVRRLTG